MSDRIVPLISCEHGGNRIPAPHRELFAGQEDLLESHRGWDPGALPLAAAIAETLGVQLHATRISRLLVEMNRPPDHPGLFSPISKRIPLPEREEILTRYYWPHWHAIAGEVAEVTEGGGRVLHLAIHTFTPVLDGTARKVEMGILYDPCREGEKAFAMRWRDDLREKVPEATTGIRIRFNQPYRGVSAGLPTWLRRRFSAESYMGLEVEVNQGLIRKGSQQWATLRSAILTTLRDGLLPPTPTSTRPRPSVGGRPGRWRGGPREP